MEERTERESDRRRREEKWQTCCCRDQQRACRKVLASAEKLEHTGPAEKEWSRCHRESNWQVCHSHLCQKEKEQGRQSRVPDREGGEGQGEREPHLGEKEGDQNESTERREWTPR